MELSEINEIMRILFAEKDLLGKILSVSEEKKTLIIKEDVGCLSQLLIAEETMVMELKELEDSRITLVSSLAARLGIGERELTLTALAGMMNKNELKQKLTALYNDLSELLKKQKKCNNIIKALVNRKNIYIGDMLELLLQTEPSAGIYDSGGSAKHCYSGAALFDQSV